MHKNEVVFAILEFFFNQWFEGSFPVLCPTFLVCQTNLISHMLNTFLIVGKSIQHVLNVFL